MTLAGSMMPMSTMSPYSPVRALKPPLALLGDLVGHDVEAGVLGDLGDRTGEGVERVDAEVVVDVVSSFRSRAGRGPQEPEAAGQDALLDGRAGGGGILDEGLALLHPVSVAPPTICAIPPAGETLLSFSRS